MEIECPNNAFNAFMILYKDAFESAFPLNSIKQNINILHENHG